jgi:hypothetical protein
VADVVLGQERQEVGDWPVGVADGVEEHGQGEGGKGGVLEGSLFYAGWTYAGPLPAELAAKA